MRVRTASASALVAIVALALVAPAAAQAAPAPIQPRFASSTQAPGGTWAGLEPVSVDGTARTDVEILGSTSFELRVHEPAGTTGRVLDPSLAGSIDLDVTQLAAGGAGTQGALLTAWPTSPGAIEPTGWPGANDVLTSAFSVDQRTQRWAFSYDFDFSGLAGGVLPAGSRLAVADVDVCGTGAGVGIDERFVATSDAAGAWLDYQYRVVQSGSTPPTVTYDTDANAYAVAPQCLDQGMIEVLVTTQAVTSLSLEMANRQGSGITRFGLLLPTAAPAPGVSIETTTNGVDVAAAPGPRLPVGSEVEHGFTVTNTGTTELASVVVTDDLVDAASIDCGDGTNVIPVLAVGEEATCTATSVVVLGEQARTATATGAPVDSRGVAIAGAAAPIAQDSSWLVGVVDPSGSIAPSASVDEVATGESVTFTTVVANAGVTTLDGAVVEAALPEGLEVSDAGGGDVLDGAVRWEVGPLASGESATLTLTGVVRETTPGSVLELRAAGEASVGDVVVPLEPVDACVDQEAAACASVVVSAAAPPSTAPPSTAPGTGSPPAPGGTVGGGAAGSSGGSLPATGGELLPLSWMAGMALLLLGLGVVLRRRVG
ncbi:hypothetical protein GCM10009846_01990 [Agrococcus versicolor]|uniref:Gram-positive cocci surface proteins LPxTG domain-containing protein n=1 Tax=Agrococcus versicolor TaxID=501482 RepID=A0ABP5M985_9MICO